MSVRSTVEPILSRCVLFCTCYRNLAGCASLFYQQENGLAELPNVFNSCGPRDALLNGGPGNNVYGNSANTVVTDYSYHLCKR